MATNTNTEMVTGWVGWLGFASFMLIFLGFFHIIEGVADRTNKALFVHSSGYVWVLNYQSWGWINIVGGILAVIAGLSLIKGGMFGRVYASIVLVLSMLVAVATVPVYPLWSIIVLVVDALILYAIMVHGKELRAR
jgi:hypothetical protein